mgnify:FL=1
MLRGGSIPGYFNRVVTSWYQSLGSRGPTGVLMEIGSEPKLHALKCFQNVRESWDG